MFCCSPKLALSTRSCTHAHAFTVTTCSCWTIKAAHEEAGWTPSIAAHFLRQQYIHHLEINLYNGVLARSFAVELTRLWIQLLYLASLRIMFFQMQRFEPPSIRRNRVHSTRIYCRNKYDVELPFMFMLASQKRCELLCETVPSSFIVYKQSETVSENALLSHSVAQLLTGEGKVAPVLTCSVLIASRTSVSVGTVFTHVEGDLPHLPLKCKV